MFEKVIHSELSHSHTAVTFIKKILNAFLCKIYIQSEKGSLLFDSYNKAKNRYSRDMEEKLSPGLHLAAAAEAGALVGFAE